ncbi:LOW QUALITY PROTEIN: otogelin-like protein [Sceloporus undulatus]|uniref:LOW QUALITY PROTEIN: otogelin-like protein n=1 Tax=Sceloporus undulatus TaxID=8520 RepID=UPI001C4D8121|nr:LOW QUALITY PROTEIN: otogelin-like protein [Sceloporus undulatus]
MNGAFLNSVCTLGTKGETEIDIPYLYLTGAVGELPLLKRTPRNEFNAIRQKRDLLTAEIAAVSSGAPIHEAFSHAQNSSGGSCPQDCLNGAVCTEAGVCDCETFQAQGERCQTVANGGKDRDGICKSWGQYHYETFDGIYYYFPGNCSYIFVKDCGDPEPQYTVWINNSPHCVGSVYACLRSISLFFSNQEEILIFGHEVRKGRIRLTLPQTIGNIFIERLADYILVKTTFGFSLAWDGNSGIYIKLIDEYKGKTCGLCGNYNNNTSDDFVIQNSDYKEDIAKFANSWSVQTPDDAVCVATASDFPSPCYIDAESYEDIYFKCQILLQFPFFSCHQSIDPYPYISSCMNDLCREDDDETYCRAVTEYARSCSHAGYPIRDWRDDFPACIDKCEDTFIHRDCISCCPPTCTFEKDCLGSNLHCLDGCYCPDGLILDNGTCISLSDCPCIYHGRAFPVGSTIEQECSNCICVGGTWNCTQHDCPAECSIVGDSHFTTFDGRHYTFLGICQYILVKGIGKDKFTITLQKTPCGQNLDHTCIQSVTLVLEDDINSQVTLNRGGEVQYGYSSQALNLNGYVEIQNLSSLFVQLKTKFGLKIQFAKDGERVYIQLSTDWKKRTLGLCGTYNGNLRDDFLSPAGMIEGTPQLHASAWKVSSACHVPVNIPVVDPCNINQQNAGYASQCDVINQDLFAPCHVYINPGLYYQLCRFDACKCGSSCLCNALAHYAHVCRKHGISIDFRSQVSYCALVCRSGMLYHPCSSFCEHSCSSLSVLDTCDHDCAEGCNCPQGKYFEDSINFCVPVASCRCYYKGRSFQPGEIMPTPLGSCQCLNGTMRCTEATAAPAVQTCHEGKIYYDCRSHVPGLPSAGVNCELSCANLAMNFTCAPSPPCVSGCICPPGMAEHKGKCYVPDSCPCTWKDWEYMSGETIATPCYTCICRRGVFNCTYYPCPAVCTVYGDRHYYTFDGLEYDYVSDCQVYLVKGANSSNLSVIVQNKKCFDNDIVCSKNVFISVGDAEIFFNEPLDLQKHENKSKYQLWKAGFYIAVHFPEQEITVLWDRKTTIHIKVGARWKGKLSGLCGNFDKYTSNDLITSNNMEIKNAQIFGESWAIGQCASPNETIKPCEVHQSKFPYAKKECSVLYSDVFAPCRNVIDVTSFVKNCHTDTCNCNLGADCECLCTSIAAYAHKCCQEGAVIHWRSPSLCPYDCDYYNQGLGEGPYILASYGQNDTVIGVNITSKKIFPLPRISISGNVYFNFMLTPGLFKDKILSPSLVSLESAERPNYFLYVHDNKSICLEQWDARPAFRRRATFFHHQGLWIPGYSAFELHRKKGFFIILTTSAVKVSKYDNSEEFKRSSSFSIEELHTAVPYRRMCEWRYEPCTSPCVKTCSDPEGTACKFLPPVEGCLPYCPKDMILDEVTLKCVYPEDCIPVKPTESSSGTKLTLLSTHLVDTVKTSSQMPPKFVTEGVELIYINLTTKITTEKIKSNEQMLTDLHTAASFHTGTTLLDRYSATTPFARHGSTSPTTFPVASISTTTVKTTSNSTSPIFFMSLPSETSAIQLSTTFPLMTTSTKPLGSTISSAAVATLPVRQDFASAETPISLLTTGSLSTSPSPVLIGAATQSLLIERPSLPSPTLLTHSPSTHTFTVVSKSKPYLSSFPSTMPPVPLFTSKFTVFDKRPLYSISSSDSMTIPPASKTETKTLLHTSVSSPKTLVTPEYIVPLTTKHFTTTADIHSGISSSVATQRPTTLSSLGLNVTHSMSALVTPPITSQRPKATGEVTIVSKSFHIGPSTGSFPGVPQASKPFLASTGPKESKYVLPTDSSAVPAVFMSSSEFTGTRALPSSTSELPIKMSYDTVQTTSKASVDKFVPQTELKASSVVHSADTSTTFAEFSGTSSFASPSVLLTVLTRSSTPQISVSASPSAHSSIMHQTGMTFPLIPTATHIQMPVVSLGEKATSRSPDSYLAASPSVIPLSSADISTIGTTYLPPVKVSDEAVLSWEATSSLTIPVDNRTLSSLPSTFSTQFAEQAFTVGALSNITSVLADVTEKYSLSPSVSLLSSVGTTSPPKTKQVTEFSPVGLKFHTATESVPIPATSQTMMYAPNITLFTSRLSTEAFRTMPIKTAEVITSGGGELSVAQTSELKNATSGRETAYSLASNQTSEIQESTHTKELSLLPIQVTPFISEGSTVPAKPVTLSDVTASDWSRVPPPKSFGPYYSVTEPQQIRITSLPNVTITDSSRSPAVSLGTQKSQVEMEVMATESAEYASFGTMIHSLMSATSLECTPRYLDPVDQCTQYVCINMGWMLYNLSRNCHKNVEKPDCGFRGMPIQINSDSCCPEWECPCQCSVLSELSIITFDGNNLALYKVASYILVKLPTEIIVAHIEKCPTNQSANSIRKHAPPGSASGLCFKKLNVTTPLYTVLINRLARKVVVDAVIQSLPFLKHGLCIQDTGAMYVINTPAGINIKWAHVTGIIDIQYGFHSNTSTKTEGLCGVCNGDPVDDWKMQNRTVITNMEEIEAFIKSWEIEKSIDVTTRKLVRNCTEDNCTYCMELLNRWVFVPCHKKVSPQDFCEKMWINNTYFWNYECDALSAYVALCNKHNICIKWRTPDYCSLSCPDGKEYQPCVQPCAAKTCLNKWFYEESPCSYLREDCVCKNGTILHRTDSDLCIPEEKCACTDNEGHPHSVGEEWNGSNKGCCMYKCLENGSIISIEPECKKEPTPICEREGEVIINIIEERACCPKKICECNMTLCDSIIPKCKNMEKLVVGYSPYSCCPQYRCECDASACPNASRPECREDQFIVEAKQEDPCCFSYLCVCESCIEPIPLCNEGEILTVHRNTTHYCCPHYHCVCDETLCRSPLLNCSVDMKLVKKRVPGQCCPDWICECNCENLTVPACKVGEVQRIDSSVSTMCGCPQYICEKDNVCVFQEVTILSPGQAMIQYLDGDLCYTAKCSHERDPNTGFYAMDLIVVNCSKKCEAHQVYVPSLSQHSCCGSCINTSCPFDTGNGTLVIHEEGSTWVSNCIKYECTKTAIGAIVLGSNIICPPFNETECTKNGGTVQTYNDGCCKTCKRDDRICQKVTIRTTIRKHDCISQSPINMASCDGKCPSATIFNVNINSHLRFCKCCRESGVQNLTVPLYCSGNGTEIMYVIQEPTDCSCQWT